MKRLPLPLIALFFLNSACSSNGQPADHATGQTGGSSLGGAEGGAVASAAGGSSQGGSGLGGASQGGSGLGGASQGGSGLGGAQEGGAPQGGTGQGGSGQGGAQEGGAPQGGTGQGGSGQGGAQEGGSPQGGTGQGGTGQGGAQEGGAPQGGTGQGGAQEGGTGAGGSTTTFDGPIGFASQNGGTIGGEEGRTVTVSNYADLKSYAESSEPYVILIDGEITNGSGGGQIRLESQKSLIGVGSGAFLSGIGLDISDASDIIVRNLRLTLVGTSNPSGVNGGDVISISGTSKNVWIDHCELYSEDPSVQTDIDKYDGLIDIKGQTGFITISWCYLHDHHKGGLVGASDTDLFDDRKVTFHHNHYENVRLRIPMYRGSVGHFFNNYVVGATDATEIRAGTCLRVEKNYYESLHYSIYTPSEAPGSTERLDNVEVERTSRAYPSNCIADIPYEYANVLTEATLDVKEVVPAGAGVGRL